MLKLDLLDKKLLYYLDLDSRQSAAEISRKLRIPKETVNFRINRLIKNKVIKSFYAILDTSKIGHYFFKIFIKFKEIPLARKKEILDYIAKQKGVAQLLLLEGKYDVQLFYLVQSNSDLLPLMEKLNQFCGKDIHEKTILITEALYKYNLKYFYNDKEEVRVVSKSTKQEYKMDEMSWKVLQQITNDARISILDLAKNLNISSQLAQYHLRKLIKDKVILYFTLAIDYETLGLFPYHFTFQVNDHNVIPQILTFFNQSGKSIFATKMVDTYDCSSELIVQDHKELRDFKDKLLEQFADKINIMDIMLVYDEYKMRLYPI